MDELLRLEIAWLSVVASVATETFCAFVGGIAIEVFVAFAIAMVAIFIEGLIACPGVVGRA